MVAFAYKSITYNSIVYYITFIDSSFAHKNYCQQLDCIYVLLHKNLKNGITFAYMYYCLQALLCTNKIKIK